MSSAKSLHTRTRVLVLSVLATALLMGPAAPASAVDLSGIGALGSGVGAATNTTVQAVNSVVRMVVGTVVGLVP